MVTVDLNGYFKYSEPMPLTAVSLFAGVGGFDLAMERQGIKVVATVEIDKHARGVLQKHFPNSTHFEDVTKVTGKDLLNAGFAPDRGIITGGFPCQDLSVAGKRAGLAGERSGLYWEIVRLVDELRPKYFVLENVPGLLTSNQGRDFGIVIGEMAKRGYGVSWRVLDAQYFGVPQRRRRVFIVGCLGDAERTSKILSLSEGLRGDSPKGRTSREETTRSSGNGSEGAISLYEPHHGDGRESVDRANTLNARMGTGGNNLPVLVEPIPIHDQATRFAGKRGENQDGKGNGLGVGNPGDPMNTLTQGDRHAVFVEPANGGGILNCLPAELYHHGTVVNQDVNSGFLILSTDKPDSPDTQKTK